MRFIEDGPSIPDPLLQSRDEGRVVFSCGAGVSRARARLADFFGLAEVVIHALGASADSDPYARGDESWQHESRDGDSGLSALGFAALYEHFDVFDLKQVRLKPDESELQHVLKYACDGQGMELLKRLLELGVDPNDQANGGSSAAQHALVMMGWSLRIYTWEREANIDSSSSRERMKAIHVLAKSGARWAPKDRSELNSARQSLVRLVPDYTVEVVWIMKKYQACCRETIQQLIGTPKMRTHVKGRRTRIDQLLGHWEEG